MTQMTDDVRRLIKAGDLPGAVRSLRPHAETAPLADLAKAAKYLAEAAGFYDLAKAAKAAAKKPRSPQALYDFGYGCVERGIAFLAVAPLRQALALVPDSRRLLQELVSALEDEQRHGEAAALLAGRGPGLAPWPEGYLLVHNALFAGDLDTARRTAAGLADPEDPMWLGARARQRRILSRAALAEAAGGLGGQDLRGWHFALTGGLLATLSPYGFDAGMTGRYAYLGDDPALCRRGIDRLGLVLDAAGRRPASVSILPGRACTVIGLAAAELLGLPAVPYDPARPDTLVVAYDLNAHDPELLFSLHERTDGHVLYEHATCWTDPPAVTADVSGLLAQHTVAPWAENGQRPADTRPVEEIARDIVTADPAPDGGDGQTPADPDEALRGFTAAVAAGWLDGPRDRVRSCGPVRSSRFG
ncbi:hypothetical protein [Streptomyces sp. A1547]|uniref:hypothetical protein n=1 Tax=Streptomyces sp. A1547 TaxID=2563105 RepID=UPI00109E9BF9|nr:hypothetical protein [Streptomyces sp. A1547]THA37509.1 hypothetical protein E6W17_20185 [Streptomyces sp. A1547]